MKTGTNNQKRTVTKKVVGFRVLEEECIWMKAGVVNFRMCDNAYDCYNCPFDKGMGKTMQLMTHEGAKKGDPAWVDYLRKQYHGSSRPCRHALTGRIDAPKICPHNYECYHCAYDQMLDEMDFAQAIDSVHYKRISGYRMADGYYYHMGHTWARFEHGGRVRVGVDEFLLKLFGAMKALTLPPPGASLRQHEVAWAFRRNGHEAAVLSPVTGTVLATNHKALDHPDITNMDPYQSGWLLMVEPRFPKGNLKGLYFGSESYKWMETENQTLMSFLGPEYGKLAATGGEVINDIYGTLLESSLDLGWDRLVRTFLRTEGV